MKRIAYSLLFCTTLLAQDLSPDQALSFRLRTQSVGSKSATQTTAPFNQGDDILQPNAVAGYNSPAGTLLNNSYYDLISDLFVNASALYYFAHQEGLNLANSGQLVTILGGKAASTAISNGTILSQENHFQPGFKLGVGMNISEWRIAAEYSWIHQTTHTNREAPTPVSTNSGDGVWSPTNWFQQVSTGGHTVAGSAIESTWKLRMDILDVTTGRPFYKGKNLTASPFFGLRAGWIDQEMRVILTNSPVGTNDSAIESFNSSKSWSLGPRTGFQASCLLGQGFRLTGDAAAGLLYTQYTEVNHEEKALTAASPVVCAFSQTNINTVRPELKMGVGLGWGTYLADQRFHIDLAAGYDFLVFWEQNMIRKNLDEAVTGVSTTANNLYLHGLNVTAGFDF